MAQTTAYDSIEFDSLDFPYNKILSDLSPVVRLVAGNNTYVTFGGKLVKRYGTNAVANTTLTGNRRIDRCIIYRTLDNPTRIYLVASAYNPGTGYWEIWHNRLDGGSPGWVNTSVGNLRFSNQSTQAHEMTISRGVVYIKSYPTAVSGEKLGTVLFDGSGATKFTIWGILAPSNPVAVSSPAGWGASAHAVTVRYGWAYVYCYVTATGQVSCHSPLETNPDNLPSVTGAFTNKIPTMTVTGQADTTNIPYINIYRTTDGGGNFYFIQQIANTGAGNITFQDKFQASGSGNADPIADVNINTTRTAPSTTSNNPPPSVAAPLIVGTDPVAASTPMVTYAGRIWYAIGNILFYSAQEEIVDGIPEESFPSGITGNFFRFPYPILNLVSTSLALLVITTESVYQIPGSNKETFFTRPLFGNIGGAENAPRSAISMGDNAIWLTQDYRIAGTRNGNLQILSAPLGTDLIDAANTANTEIQLAYWAENEKDFLLVAAWNKTTPTLSKIWVYDVAKSAFLKQDFWNTPWLIQASHMISGRYRETNFRRYLAFCMYSPSSGAQINNWDSTGVTATDDNVGATGAPYGFTVDTFLVSQPPGNHINTLSVPARVPVCEALILNRTQFTADTEPFVFAFRDDFWQNPIQLPPPELPYGRQESKGYKTLLYNFKETAQKVAFRFTKGANNERFELQTFIIVFNPVFGV